MKKILETEKFWIDWKNNNCKPFQLTSEKFASKNLLEKKNIF